MVFRKYVVLSSRNERFFDSYLDALDYSSILSKLGIDSVIKKF